MVTIEPAGSGTPPALEAWIGPLIAPGVELTASITKSGVTLASKMNHALLAGVALLSWARICQW